MQNSAEMEAIFFDLDGTLTDPKEGITGCIQHALQQMGESVPSKDELTWCIGPPLDENFRVLVGSERVQQGVDLYRERFASIGLFQNLVYDGIPEVLETLSALCPLYVASSKPLVFVDRILEHFELERFFTRTFGSGLDGSLADKSELLAHALSETSVCKNHGLMIGDRSHDAVGARNNGMNFIGALYGYGGIEEYRASGFSRWAESPAGLISLVHSSGDGL